MSKADGGVAKDPEADDEGTYWVMAITTDRTLPDSGGCRSRRQLFDGVIATNS